MQLHVCLLVVVFGFYFLGFAEKLFSQLELCSERFEVKVMMVNLISRLIGIHQLLLFNFYPFMQRFLKPHQRGKGIYVFD